MLVGMEFLGASEAPSVEVDTARTYAEAGIEPVDRHTVTAEESDQELVMGTGTDQVARHFA
jgi:hypothetical protein